jgi:xanthine/uracil/vitamin C permease (AzgA family)
LILLGALMSGAIARVKWDDFTEAFPAFMTVVATPLTFRIATGLSLGLLSLPPQSCFRAIPRDQSADLDSLGTFPLPLRIPR